MENNVYSAERLVNFIIQVLHKSGIQKEHAEICASRMIEADLRGMHGHGIYRLPMYYRRLKEGGYNLNPEIRIERETPVSALVDGDNGLGQVVVTTAVTLAIQKAKENGMAWIGIKHSNHAGAGGVYTAMSIPHDLISMYMAIGNANHMPPWQGIDMLLSTNPISYAIPTKNEPPLVLDMATTVASYGKIKVTAQKGEPLPEGWLVDRYGKPVTDPERISEGFLLPIGGHKGYGLNCIIGALAGVLNGAAFGSAVIDFNKDFKSPTNSGQVYFAMKPDLFRDLNDFKEEMDMRIREIRNSTPMKEDQPIHLPGEMAVKREQQMRDHGVPVASTVISQLQDIARNLELDDVLEN